MPDPLYHSELFAGMDDELASPLYAIAQHRSIPKGEYLFLLGDHADQLYVVLEGKVEVCFPLSLNGAVKDVAVQTLEVGKAVGLSALVKPYRFTLSARTAEKSLLACFPRTGLLRVFEDEPRTGCAFLERLTDVLGRRLLTIEALWARELQRSLSSAKPSSAAKERSAT